MASGELSPRMGTEHAGCPSSVARNTASAIAPVFAGTTLAVPALGLPFLIVGSLKAVYDLALFAVFRKVRPPEERIEKGG